MRCARPGKLVSPRQNHAAVEPERQRSAASARRRSARCACRAASRCRRGARSRARLPPVRAHDARRRRHKTPSRNGACTETRMTPLPALLDAVRGVARVAVVDADHRSVARIRLRQALLDGGVASMVPWRSRWSGVMLSSTPTSGRATASGRSGRTSTRARSCVRGASGSSASTAVPILPPTGRRGRPARRWPISAVVVDLPFVPVMATNGRPAVWRRSRQNSSMSPMISTPAPARKLHRPDAARDGSAERRARARAPRPSPSRARSGSHGRQCSASASWPHRRARAALVVASDDRPAAPPAMQRLRGRAGRDARQAEDARQSRR